MSLLDELKDKNEKGELPKKFTDEEIEKIYLSEINGLGCGMCPMAPFEMPVEVPVVENKKEYSGHGLDYPIQMLKEARDMTDCNRDENFEYILKETDENVYYGSFGEFTSCGDQVDIWLKIENDIITDIKWASTGCYGSCASGSYCCKLLKGTKASEFNFEKSLKDMMDYLQPPAIKKHCAMYPLKSIEIALKNYKN